MRVSGGVGAPMFNVMSALCKQKPETFIEQEGGKKRRKAERTIIYSTEQVDSLIEVLSRSS